MSSSAIAALHQGGQGPRWSDEAMLAELRASAERHGKLRTRTFLADYRDGLTDLDPRSVYLRFGTWIAACRAAGYEPGRGRRTYQRTTAEECVAAIREAAGVFGEMPSIGDYEALRTLEPERALPCQALVRQRCGSWLKALQMAEAPSSPPVSEET